MITSLYKKYGWAKYDIFNNLQDIDLKIIRDMNQSMAYIIVTVTFSGKCLFMGATFNF